MAQVKYHHDQWGFMDTTGRLVIQPMFDAVLPFRDGLAWVSIGGKWGYVNGWGDWVWREK
ncbi:MAG: WG repeat-containing protein [Saprospiraceae bacterium]|nr:WG repeat-containing protein [Saprospiraceae bacterium]